MNAKIADVFFVKRRWVIGPPPTPRIEDGQDGQTAEVKPTVTTLADSMSPLLTSMKLFGQYFRRGTKETSGRRRNLYLIHAVFVVILAWINALRMLSVFMNKFLPF